MDARSTVLRTLAFADAFEMPLTAFETWMFLFTDRSFDSAQDKQPTTNNQQLSFSDIFRELEELKRSKDVGEETGFYFLAGRDHLVAERLCNIALASRKVKRAERWAKWIVRLPYVRGVFAHGSLAMEQTKEESDLDVLIVVAPGRMFLARLFVTWFTEMFGVRRHREKIRDRICLNHYVTEDALLYSHPSAFAAWLWARIFPLAQRDPFPFEKFQSKNKWVERWLTNAGMGEGKEGKADREGRERKQNFTLFTLFPHFLLDRIERILGALQLRRISRNPLTQRPGARIVASSETLLFNPELPEERILQKYRQNLERLKV